MASREGLSHPKRDNSRKHEGSLLRRWALIRRVLDWVRRELIPSSGPAARYEPFLRRLETQLRCQGLKGSIAYCKRRRQEILGYLAAEPNSPKERQYRLKLISAWGHSGAAVVLKKEVSSLRMILTVCTALRSFRLPVRVDLKPITSPGVILDGVVSPGAITAFWRELRRRFRVPKLETAEFREWHFSLKSGPGKGQALLSWANDLISLPDDLVEDLTVVGGGVFKSHLESLLRNLPAIRRVYSPRIVPIRRVAGIADLEGKTRVIAMLDYFSQAVLYPVHTFLFAILRQIPQDVTFHQGSFVDQVKTWGPDIRLLSLDLTAATDRFPIEVIARVLGGCFPQRWVDSWRRIMVSHRFAADGHPDGIVYAVGNPMGAYSSWASFALAHHFVVFQAAQKVGVPWRSCRYVLLGDDILFGDALVGEEYRRIMTALGVEINDLKTHDSHYLGEFAKRYFYRGQEISPFPVSAVLDNLGEIPLLVSAIDGEAKKGFVPSSGIPGSLGELARTLYYRRRTCLRWVEWARTAQLGLEYGRGNVEALEFIQGLNHASSEAWAEVIFREGDRLITQALETLLVQSLASEKVGAGLGLVDQVQSLLWGGSEDGTSAEADLPANLPVLGVLMRFEKDLMALSNSADPGEALEEFMANPLQASSWGMDARARRARGYGRLARAVLSTVEERAETFWGVGDPPEVPALLSPWQSVGIWAHQTYMMSQMASGRLRGAALQAWMQQLGGIHPGYLLLIGLGVLIRRIGQNGPPVPPDRGGSQPHLSALRKIDFQPALNSGAA